MNDITILNNRNNENSVYSNQSEGKKMALRLPSFCAYQAWEVLI